MKKFSQLAYGSVEDLMYGRARHPLNLRSGMVLGDGTVYPELNFTLPPMLVEKSTIPAIYEQYKQIIADATRRAAELEALGLVVEFELLPPMTEVPYSSSVLPASSSEKKPTPRTQ